MLRSPCWRGHRRTPGDRAAPTFVLRRSRLPGASGLSGPPTAVPPPPDGHSTRGLRREQLPGSAHASQTVGAQAGCFQVARFRADAYSIVTGTEWLLNCNCFSMSVLSPNCKVSLRAVLAKASLTVCSPRFRTWGGLSLKAGLCIKVRKSQECVRASFRDSKAHALHLFSPLVAAMSSMALRVAVTHRVWFCFFSALRQGPQLQDLFLWGSRSVSCNSVFSVIPGMAVTPSPFGR